MSAESKNPTDYPLRVLIFSQKQTNVFFNNGLESTKGEGRANLFANGDVHGMDFSFDCPKKIASSFRYETYPARWKKPNQELIVLFPVFGQANAYFTCNLKTEIKDTAYLWRNGGLDSEPVAEFKAWMAKHDYDPEHGKNVPMKAEPQSAAAGQPGSPSQ